MKAMSQTLYLVVAAMVILITAVVVLVIFFQGMAPATGFAEASALCQTKLSVSCTTFGENPPDWNVQNVKVRDSAQKLVTTSCSVLVTECTCDKEKKVITGDCKTKKY